MKFKKILGPDQTNKEAVTRQRPPTDKYVPIPDDGFPEVPARYPTLADAFDSCQRRVHSYQGQMHPEPSEIDSTFPDN